MTTRAKGEFIHEDLKTQLMVGVIQTERGTRVRLTYGEDKGFVMTPAGAQWLADVLNATANLVMLPAYSTDEKSAKEIASDLIEEDIREQSWQTLYPDEEELSK